MAFYAWIQVRNIAAVEKVDMDRARKLYEKTLTKKVFHAWHYSHVSWFTVINTQDTSLFLLIIIVTTTTRSLQSLY